MRIFRDDKDSLIESLGVIRKQAGEVSSELEGLFEGVSASIKAGNFKNAIAFTKLIAVAGKAGNLSTINKTKALAHGLIERLKRFAKENDDTEVMYQANLLEAKPITNKELKELKKIALEEFIDPKEAQTVLESFIGLLNRWQKWDKSALALSIDEALEKARDILTRNRLYCNVRVYQIVNYRMEHKALKKDVIDGTNLEDLKKRFYSEIESYKRKNNILENYLVKITFEGIKLTKKSGDAGVKIKTEYVKEHKFKANDKADVDNEFNKLKRQYSQISDTEGYVGYLYGVAKALNNHTKGFLIEKVSISNSNEKSIDAENNNKEVYYTAKICVEKENGFGYSKQFDIRDKKSNYVRFTTEKEAVEKAKEYMDKEGYSGDIYIYLFDKSYTGKFVKRYEFDSKNNRRKILGARRAEENKKKKEEFEKNKPKDYKEFEVGKSYIGKAYDPWNDSHMYKPVFTILGRTNANVTAKVTEGGSVTFDNIRIKIRPGTVQENIYFEKGGHYYSCDAKNVYTGGDTKDPYYDPNAYWTH